MTWWQGILLGIVQGLTEFLPISSSGHLVIAQAAVGLTVPGVIVEVALHLATLLAVIVVYWERLWELISGTVAGDRAAWTYVGLLLLGSIPAGFVGVLFASWFERAFDSLLVVGFDFLVTAAVLWSTRWVRLADVGARPTALAAFAIGCAQALAVLPGISRSGTTISTAVWLRVDPVRAAEYSFLLAIPAVAGAAALQIPDVASGAVGAVGAAPLVAGFAASLASGILAIRMLVLLLRRGTFHRFAPYCFILGIFTILWALLG
jgi:undecaprenyl-diphosphatase